MGSLPAAKFHVSSESHVLAAPPVRIDVIDEFNVVDDKGEATQGGMNGVDRSRVRVGPEIEMVTRIKEAEDNLVPFSTRTVRGSKLGSRDPGRESSGEGGRAIPLSRVPPKAFPVPPTALASSVVLLTPSLPPLNLLALPSSPSELITAKP